MIAARPYALALRRSSGPLAALAAALLVAACGGGGGDDPIVPPPPTCTVANDVTLAGGWQLVAPAAWNGCATITLRAPALATNERLAVVLLNSGGLDNAAPALTTGGTAAFAAIGPGPVAAFEAGGADATRPTAGAPLVLLPEAERFDRSGQEAGHALAVARREAGMEGFLAALAAGPAPRTARFAATIPADPAVGSAAPNGGFCTYSYATDTTTRKPATLRHKTAHALFYVDDSRWTDFQTVLVARPDFWTTMESYFEGTVSAKNPAGARRIYPALRENFGAESDIDQNGKVVVYFTDTGRPPDTTSYVVGYFDPLDVSPGVDLTAGCTQAQPNVRTAGNGTDMLYMLDPHRYRTYSGAVGYDGVVDVGIPGTMAHELQHDVFINTRCIQSRLANCTTAGLNADLFLNEGLSMNSEDFAGFGLNTAVERGYVGDYLNQYQGYSLTIWPDAGGDPVGHYGGAHAFLRWHLDQAAAGNAVQPTASAFAKALVASPQLARLSLATASGVSFEEGWARFATGALFSGETFSPQPAWSFASGVPWSPLHTAVGYTNYTSLPRPGQPTFLTNLKADGWAAFVTGVGQGGEATVRIDSSAAVKPQVVVMRFRGSLPR